MERHYLNYGNPINPLFKPWYCNNLMHAKNGQINSHQHATFDEKVVERNPWLHQELERHDPNYTTNLPFYCASKSGAIVWGAEPNEIINLYGAYENIPDETHKKLIIDHKAMNACLLQVEQDLNKQTNGLSTL
jgi:hypothetical protein